ncbi:hypothetical protein OAO55_01680 [Bacteroidales bacterium]|nr:hypothetical protein [Bacteroidales bacterium]
MKVFKIIVLFVLLLSTNIYTQFNSNQFVLRGGVSGYFENQKYTDDYVMNEFVTNRHSVSVIPYIGYTISESEIIGLGIGYKRYCSKQETLGFVTGTSVIAGNSISENLSNELIITPYYRKYISVGEKLSFYFDGNGNVGFGKIKNVNNYKDLRSVNPNNYIENKREVEGDSFSIGIDLSAGISYKLTEKLMVELRLAGLWYDWSKETLELEDKLITNIDSKFDYRLNSIGLSVSYLF